MRTQFLTNSSNKQLSRNKQKNNIDILITVGEYAKEIANRAEKLGTKKVLKCNSIEEASNNLKEIMTSGDIILLKASHSMNFSKILEYIK